MKSMKYKAEYLQLNDELNDIREWRQNYLISKIVENKEQNNENTDVLSRDNSSTSSDNVSVTSVGSSNASSSVSSIKMKMKDLYRNTRRKSNLFAHKNNDEINDKLCVSTKVSNIYFFYY